MRRVAYWTAVVVAVAAVGAGGWFAYDSYRHSSGPETRVRAYFAAIARGDAPAALSYGDLPPGPHDLLTSQVLQQQQRIAPLHDVQVFGVAEDGADATVRFRYQLRFARGNQEVTGTLSLHRDDGSWRLDATAVPVAISVDQALDRFTFAGTAVPSGTTMLFPGALPIRFDTPNLQVDRSAAAVQFGGDRTLDVTIEPTAAARTTLTSRLDALVRSCLSTKPAAGCPTPSARVVPGTLTGSVVGELAPKITFSVGSSAAGLVELSAKVVVAARYRALTYDNIATARQGRIPFVIDAQAPATSLAVQFSETS